MATVTNSIFQSGAATPGLTLSANEALTVSAQAGIFATGSGASPAIHAIGANNTMNIHGGVFSSSYIGIFGEGGGNYTISIGAAGSVFGGAGGIHATAGGNNIANAGQINGGFGIAIAGAGSNVISNTGYIRAGGGVGITVGGADNTLNNSGVIDATDIGLGVLLSGDIVNTGTIRGAGGVLFGEEGPNNSLSNSGTIIAVDSMSYGVLGGAGQEAVVNNGSIVGGVAAAAVALFGGNDSYDGRGGTAVGAVAGGAGIDTLWGGAAIDRLEGGTENDQINGGGSGDYIDGGAGYDFARYDFATGGVQARLDNAALNTGEAAGDTMYNFEGLVGSQFGDILAGNDLAIGNQIYGLGGNDTIRGNGGADILYGNAGADSYFTGAGTDTVYVQAADLIATQLDRVFDFTDGQDHLRFQGISQASATITDSQGGTLIQFNVTGGQFSVFLDNITKAAALDQIFFV